MNSDKYSVSNYFIRVVFSYHKNIDFYVICYKFLIFDRLDDNLNLWTTFLSSPAFSVCIPLRDSSLGARGSTLPTSTSASSVLRGTTSTKATVCLAQVRVLMLIASQRRRSSITRELLFLLDQAEVNLQHLKVSPHHRQLQDHLRQLHLHQGKLHHLLQKRKKRAQQAWWIFWRCCHHIVCILRLAVQEWNANNAKEVLT